MLAYYFNNLPLVRKLSNQEAAHLLSLLKIFFLQPGIPTGVFTDQGWQFTSDELQEFAGWNQFEICHSRPRYPQSSGFIEAMVKIVKKTMSKAELSGGDPYLAVLYLTIESHKWVQGNSAQLKQ